MNYLKYITAFFLFVLLSSCGKDDFVDAGDPSVSIVDEIIKGTAMLDQDLDGIFEFPMAGATVYYADSIYKEYDADGFGGSDVLKVTVDEFGAFEFVGVPPAQGKALFILPDVPATLKYFTIIGEDTEPDGDAKETEPTVKINIDLETDEIDSGNDFFITKHPIAISGSILLDADLDGIGEVEVPSYFVYLFERLPDGSPSTVLVSSQLTNANGVFEFYDIEPGEYVLEIQNNSNYYVFSGGDDTPDPDGMSDPNRPNLIPVDLEIEETDTDNNFTLRNNVVGTISGTVGNAIDQAGNIDFGLQQIKVGLFDAMSGNMINNAYTDENGAFSFGNLPGQYELKLLSTDDYIFNAAGDFSNDGDATDENISQDNKIEVTLGQNEQDMDNNFIIVIQKGRISGRILEDVNNDGVGDRPIYNDIIQLSFRDADGGPISDPSAPWNDTIAYSDINGYYWFEVDEIPESGAFVINHIGTGAHVFECISSEDLSPEPGEPQNQHPYCSLIQCDLSQMDSEDHHNVYIIDIQ